jgi:shikimate dehydrogenase
MIRSGLLGRSILASRSPYLHEQEARTQGLELSYELFDFTDRGLTDDDLPAMLDRLRAEGFAGFNVTYPFKQAIMPLLDSLAESAATVGAVNTVAIRDGRLIGHNTDMAGFRDSIEQGLPGAALGHVVQIGAGGAGSAVGHALLSLAVERLDLVDLDIDRARTLRDELARRHPDRQVNAIALEAIATHDADGIVNATPIGMNGKPGLPISVELIELRHWLADIIYFPAETELLRAAREKGCRTMNGVGMVVGQAARAFEIITGHKADNARMRATF